MRVVLTGRRPDAVDERVAELRAEELDVVGVQLDITDPVSVETFAKSLALVFERVDVLVNNAAATNDFRQQPSTQDLEQARDALNTTLLGTWRVTQALLPLLRKSPHARIVNVSSGAGSHGDASFGLSTGNAMGPAYAISKAALNALTACFANELRAEHILVNAVCPWLTATFPGASDMGARPVAAGAASVVWAATLGPDGPTGGLFRDGAPLPW